MTSLFKAVGIASKASNVSKVSKARRLGQAANIASVAGTVIVVGGSAFTGAKVVEGAVDGVNAFGEDVSSTSKQLTPYLLVGALVVLVIMSKRK